MLPTFITEAERFATLEGNVGRKVTRHLEHLFANGQFAAEMGCADTHDEVDDALFTIRMQKCKELQKEYAGDGFTICVQPLGFFGEVKVIIIPLTVPETLREKQAQLATFARIMRGFFVFAVMTSRDVLDKLRREHFGDDLPPRAGDVQYTYLRELLKGDYTNLERTAGDILTLAAALNPAVTEALRTTLASEPLAA